MARAHPGHAARQNLAALLHELRKNVGALVVDEIHLLDPELADFLFAEILALAAARTAGSTRAAGTSGATFAATDSGTAFSAGTGVVPLAARGSGCWRGGVTAFAGGGRGSRSGRRLFVFVGHNFLPFQVQFEIRHKSEPT